MTVYDLADISDLILSQFIGLGIKVDAGLIQYLSRRTPTNSIYIGQSNFNPLVLW